MKRVFAENTDIKAWFEDESGDDGAWNLTADDLTAGALTAGNATVSNARVYIEVEHLDHDILKLNILCERIETPVLGIAFHLEYSKDLLHFLRYDPGTFLEQGGDPFYIVSDNNGVVIFGETLRRNDSFPVGGGNITSIYFQKNSSYDADDVLEFKFKNGEVSGLDSTRQDIDTVNFENFPSETLLTDIATDESDIKTSSASTMSANVFVGDFQQYFLGVLSTFGIIFILISTVLFIKYIKASRKI